jgi:hypothetical protein
MSGPKVVRIVSLEEILQICRQWLTRVQAEIDQWLAVGERNQLVSEDDKCKVIGELRRLQKLLESSQFMKVQKNCEATIEWLRTDMEDRLEKQQSAEAKKNRMQRSLSFTAAAIVRRSRELGTTLPLEIHAILERAAASDIVDIDKVNSAAADAMRFMESFTAAKSAEVAKDLAARLSDGLKTQSLPEWLAASQEFWDDPRLLMVEKQLVLLKQLAENSLMDTYQKRFSAARAETDGRRRSLLLDALLFDLSNVTKEASEWSNICRQFSVLKLESETTGQSEELTSLFLQWTSVEEKRDVAGARLLFEKINQARDTMSKQKAADAKRQALLSGLKSIGYSVSEGMEQLWKTERRVVVRSSENPQTALELAGDVESGRCQVRAVEIEGGSPLNREDGKRVEENWCHEFSKLQELMAKQGGVLSIERSVPAGAQPLKIVPDHWGEIAEEPIARRRELRK